MLGELTKKEKLRATLNMKFSIIYYLELCNEISIYCISHIFTNKCQIGCLDIIEHQQFYLVKKLNQ